MGELSSHIRVTSSQAIVTYTWFCTHCPTVVTDPADDGEMLQHGLPNWDVGSEFALAGMV